MQLFAVNANTLSVSEYTDLDIVDAATHEGELFLLQAELLVKLDATVTPTAAIPIILTGMLSLGADEKKYVSGLKATLSGDDTTDMWMTIELDGNTIAMGPYDLVGRSGSAAFVRRWRHAGGVKADNLSVKLQAATGASWGVHGLTVSTELL